MSSMYISKNTYFYVLYIEEPTEPEMRPPRPMINNNNKTHTYSYSYHKVNVSRTDLGIDASGDDTSQLTTSGSDENDADALDSSSDSGTVEIHHDLSDNMNSSPGSSPSPSKRDIEKKK